MDAERHTIVQRARLRIGKAQGRRRALLAFVAGSLSVLAFAPFHAAPVLLLTLPVFLWLIDASKSPRDAAIAGWWTGFGYFLFNLFWIGEAFLVEADKFAWMLPFAVTLLPAGIALFWAAAAAVMKKFWFGGPGRVALFALVLGLAEWLRGHLFTGLPWNVIGYALTFPVELMQSASLAGIYALTFLAILVFTAPLVVLADASPALARRDYVRAAAVFVVPLAALYAFGTLRLAAGGSPDVAGMKVRLVQPSVPQREKWMPQHQREIFTTHLDMSRTSPSGEKDNLAPITHVIWPEAAMPFLPLEHPEALEAIGEMLPDGKQLISGAIRRAKDAEGRPRGYNSLMAFDSSGKLTATYDKVHLVPFGEYLPFYAILSAIGLEKLTHGLGAFDTGPLPRPLMAIPGLPAVGGLICYEVLFPGEVIDDTFRPGLIVNVTNDGWFGDTTGPRQHYFQTRVRAVEEGIPIIRVANNGISAVIDPFGRERARIDLNVRAVVDSGIPGVLPATAYAQSRSLGFWLSAFFLVASCLFARRKYGY